MGMYTEFHFNAIIEGDNLTQNDIDILNCMFNQTKEPKDLPEHKLFKTQRWSWFSNSDSAYFAQTPASSFRKKDFDDDYVLNIRCDFKNYDDEIEKFIDWIEQFVGDRDDILGFSRYEASDTMDIYYIDCFGKIQTRIFDFRNYTTNSRGE